MAGLRRASIGVATAGVAVVAAACAAPPRDLGAPDRITELGVSESGYVVECHATDSSLVAKAGWFVRPGETERQALPGPTAACPTAVNDAGVAVGYIRVGGADRPATWDLAAGTWRELGLPAGATGGRAYAVNGSGVAVGATMAGQYTDRPIRWDPAGSPTTLLGGSGAARAVNDAGLAVGIAGSATVSWAPGTAEPFVHDRQYATMGHDWSVNDRGDIAVGVAGSFGSGTVLIDHDRPTEARTDGPGLYAVHIAADGDLVGWSSGPSRAVRWDAGTDTITPLHEGDSTVLAAKDQRAVGFVYDANQAPTVIREWTW